MTASRGSRSAPTTTSPNRSTSPNSSYASARSPAANPPHTDRTLQAAGIELDPLTGTVSRDGRTIDLTAKERAVLEALLKASPAGLTAEKLLEQAWDENTDPFTNTVKVTIARLRRKLGEPQVIQTTPGIGYRIPHTPQPPARSVSDPHA